jgi:hypothetical protein
MVQLIMLSIYMLKRQHENKFELLLKVTYIYKYLFANVPMLHCPSLKI